MAIVEMTPHASWKCLLLEISQQSVKRLNLRICVGAIAKNFCFSYMCKLGAAKGPAHGRRRFKSVTRTERDHILVMV